MTPKLPYHQNLIDKFSMYMTLENNNGCLSLRWKYEPNLKRNIEFYKNRHEQFASLFNQQDNGRSIVQFWIEIAFNDQPIKQEWESQNRAETAWEHLKIYCESSCYRAAKEILKSAWKEDKYECLEEYIFFARSLIYQETKFRHILAKYDATNSSLDTYITGVLLKTIKDEAGVAKFSKWRLLCKKSDKELKEALKINGNYEPEISKFIFARKYFKQVYQMNKVQNPATRTGHKWIEPDGADFAETAKYYNAAKLLDSAPHEVYVSANTTAEQLKVWMEICITALQNYPKSVTPRFSLSALQEVSPFVSQECSEVIELDLLSLEAEASENQGSLINLTEAVLQQELLSLKPDQQEILLLYYGLGINQKEIAEKFAVTQSAIAYRLQTIERKFVKAVYALKQPPQWVTQYVEKWLNCNYQAPVYSDLIHAALVVAEKKLDTQERQILQLFYGHKLDEQQIATQLDITQPEVTEIIRKSHAKLEASVLKEIDTMIKKFLQIWLTKNSQIHVVQSKTKTLGLVQTKIQNLETIHAVL